MKRINFRVYSLLLFASAIILGCNEVEEEEVVASFSASSSDVATGETVSFTNESENASYFQWDFGDGGLSFDENPSHEYSVGGTYDVSLLAIGNSSSDSASLTVTVTADYDVSIYEGLGIDGVDLYDTWSEVNSIYTSDTLQYIYDYTDDYGYYYQLIYFYEEGLAFGFVTDDTQLSSSDYLYVIIVLSPYSGATSKGVAIGSDIDDVEELYGDAESVNDEDGYTSYWYDTQGIDFYTYDSGEVDEMDIYEAYETSSYSTKSAMIQRILQHRGTIPF